MMKSKFKVIGVMSGTSLDGIDLCYADFTYNNVWSFKIITAKTVDYPKEWANNLKASILLDKAFLIKLDENYTSYLNSVILEFIKQNEIKNLDAVCSHGHTVLHQPDKGITYQIGNMPHISNHIKCPIVCDFRIDDVKLGGQGAPLVPIGDQLLFNEFDICLNLGGFANMSLQLEGKRIAYDICPVNITLNYYVEQLGYVYDNKGIIAKSGKIHQELLNKLNALEFYSLTHPKSLGLEWVKQNVFPLVDIYQLPVENILRTLIEHSATQIGKEINKMNQSKILITGGGVYNTFLIERISNYTDNEIVIPSKTIVNYKEALVFGFLGVLKLRNEMNCLSSVTGAERDHSSGIVIK
ncbi:anhydro-N-acetylmuramic acid kinase [Flavobacteriaceae bacterium AU392]|nr:anhydro-N-acetylmuramic acid kinase [Flavobacteriaceae bacterium]RKM82628.1 anhydro-N-acetylmuramic acid kinase [Flavobacteriaceae bacterium AU392]